jgi:hypothetical protein
MNTLETPSIRVLTHNPDHHLWNNHGTWWCHYTVHLPDYTKRRVRLSLGTPSVEQARKLRDQILRRALKGGGL